jgi:hypothetical protein
VLPPAALRRARFAPAGRGLGHARAGGGWIRDHVDASERILSTPLTVLPLLVDAEDLKKDLEEPDRAPRPVDGLPRSPAGRLDGDPRWKIRVIPVAKRFDPHGMDSERADRWIDDTSAAWVLLADLGSCHRVRLEAFESARAPPAAISPTKCAG